jgi:hypothetical protein
VELKSLAVGDNSFLYVKNLEFVNRLQLYCPHTIFEVSYVFAFVRSNDSVTCETAGG